MSHSAGDGVSPKPADQNSEFKNIRAQDSRAPDSLADREAVDQPVIGDSQFLLLAGSVFIIAACSLIYELLISSLSTYLLGSSVIHYSLTIGLFLFFMGIGAWMAQSVTHHLIPVFVLSLIHI